MWSKREELTGNISGALWIRHIAEVIRRAFEDACQGLLWPEEYDAGGNRPPETNSRRFGSERPTDNIFKAKPHLAYTFGLFTGSAVRWYVEGDTEYYALRQAFPDPAAFGIETVNLRANFSGGSVPLRLTDLLQEDIRQRRFSMISFDGDRKDHEKVIKALAKNVVGHIAFHKPDFEFANFDLEELVEIAARMDDRFEGISGDVVRKADWTGIGSAKTFEERYVEVSERKPGSLKGELWGKALAAYALENPSRKNGSERTFCKQLRAAEYAWNSKYEDHKARFEIDPNTLELMQRPG
jgi:hypothetical protein